MANKVEKGQKYKGDITGKVYEILSDVFDVDGAEYVAWRRPETGIVQVDAVESFKDSSLYALIREPKFKVGDRVKRAYYMYEIVAVTDKADKAGDFGYVGIDEGGYFSLLDDSEGLEAAA